MAQRHAKRHVNMQQPPRPAPAPPAWRRRLPDAVALVLLGVLLLVLWTPPLRRQVYGVSDFAYHLFMANLFFDQHKFVISYPYFHGLVVLTRDVLIWLYALVGDPRAVESFRQFATCFPLAGMTVVLLHVLLQGAVIYGILRTTLKQLSGYWPYGISLLGALALSLITPVTLCPLDGHRYFGYIVPTVFHNPTYLVMKPLALLLFWQVTRVMEGEGVASWKLPASLVALSLLSTLAKPSYAICLLPVVALFIGYLAIKRQGRRALALAGGALLPLLLVLLLQYLHLYQGTEVTPAGTAFPIDSEVRITWAPLLAMGLTTTPAVLLAPKLLLTLLFPAVLYLMFLPAARCSPLLNGSWLVFLVSAAYLYFFAEGGARTEDLNLLWGAMAAVFILYVSSTAFLLRQTVAQPPAERDPFALIACWGALALHIASGVVWWWLQFSPRGAPL